MIGEAIERALVAMVVTVICVTAGVTAALIYGIPWLWSLLKPWIHHVTG